MKINYSNRTLWKGISIQLVVLIVVFLVVALITLGHIIFSIVSLIIVSLCFYLLYILYSIHEKLYLDISVSEVKVYDLKGNAKHDIVFSDVKQMIQVGSNIFFIMNGGEKIKISLNVMNFTDVKQLLSYLKFDPKIEHKTFNK